VAKQAERAVRLADDPYDCAMRTKGNDGAANSLVVAQKPSRAWFEAIDALIILMSDTAIAMKKAAPTKNS
jgi:hypothetical protein